jgi:geranylgeranyl diphosphate synthase type II
VDVEAVLAEYRAIVDRRLDELLPPETAEPRRLHEAMRYACLAPGKRLRPALCLSSGEACGASIESVLDAACALEMVHAFSLIHDDLPAIDDDAMRRGLPSCHVRFGEAIAILAGDGLFALAFEAISNGAGDAWRTLQAVRILSNATGSDGLVGGEVDDVLAEGREIDAEIVERIHMRKTAALIGAACETGAVLAGADRGSSEAFRDFGRLVGLAFQITDDVLNETSTSAQLGKAAGSDRGRGKATYPALHGLDAARAAAREAVERAIRLIPDDSASTLRELGRYAVERLH